MFWPCSLLFCCLYWLGASGFITGLRLRRKSPAVVSVLGDAKLKGGAPSDYVPSSSDATNPENGAYNFEYWSKAFRSQPEEFTYEIAKEDIEGTIPLLQGTLFRAMPALFSRGKTTYEHYLDGDGYVIKLSISKNNVSFRSRFVKTREFVQEAAADKVLFRSTFRTQRPSFRIKLPLVGEICLNNIFDLRLKNLANTNAFYWNGRLFSLFEAGVPHLIDPDSLEKIGDYYDMGLGDELRPGMAVLLPELYEKARVLHNSMFGAAFTAHPKIDPRRNTLVGWTWRAEVSPERSPLDTRPTISIYEWDANMRLQGPATTFCLEGTTVAPHDFSLTDDFYCFFANRVSGNTMPYVLGTQCPAQCVNIDSTKSLVLNIVKRPSGISSSLQPRVGNESVNQVIRIPVNAPGFAIHSVCAFQHSERITVLTSAWKSETVASGQVKGGLLGAWEGRAPQFDDIPATLLYETVVDYTTGKLIKHAPVSGMEDQIVEHPHINPTYEGLPVRFVWMSIGSKDGLSSPPLGYMRLDLETGEKQTWYAPLHTYCEEVVIVPKGNDATEDDCWILAAMFDSVIEKSCVGIFDGADIGKGPVARIWLRHALPHSLHGSFTTTVY